MRPAVLSRIAAVLAAVIALLYLVVGLEVVTVAGVTEVEPGPAVPLVVAGAAFAVLAAALVLRPARGVDVGGAALSVLTVVGYIAVAGGREPSYEPWGLTLKALQMALIGVLALRLSRRVDDNACAPRTR